MEALQVIFQSGMAFEEMWEKVEERMPRFREVPCLVQKVYLWDDEAEEICGLYIFENAERLDAFLGSELRASIPEAYDVQGTPEVRRWSVPATLFALGDEPSKSEGLDR